MNPTPGQRPPVGQARLRELQRGTTIEAALAFYDALEPVGLEEMTGSWRGEDLPTGNPFDGLLERFGWYGKRFDGPDHGHPLVFIASPGRTMSLNPAFVPIAALIRYPWLVRAPFVPRLFCVLRPLLATGKPKARLRLTAYRGVVTATMCYDALPINDVFRKVDNDTVLGAMDLRGLQMPFMFVLRREPLEASEAEQRGLTPRSSAESRTTWAGEGSPGPPGAIQDNPSRSRAHPGTAERLHPGSDIAARDGWR